ncbi:uncharacterized protein LOC120344362 [Styela clava]
MALKFTSASFMNSTLGPSTLLSTQDTQKNGYHSTTIVPHTSGSTTYVDQPNNSTFVSIIETTLPTNLPPQGSSLVLLYVFLPVIIILLFGGAVLAFKYSKRRSGVKRLRRQLVPLRQYDVNTDVEQDDNLLEVKMTEPCCNDPLLAFKPNERPNNLDV